MTQLEADNEEKNKKVGCQIPIKEVDAIKMTKFSFGQICGRRGSKVFLEADRPDSLTGKCKEGFSACSAVTSPDNTICVESSKLFENGEKNALSTECPITDIKFEKNYVENRKKME